MATSKTLVAILIAGFVLTGPWFVPEASAEKKRVVLMKFKGPRARTVRKAVLAVLKKKAKMVGQAKFVRAQKKLRARKTNDRDVAKVAQSLEVHGVVFGRIRRKRGKYKLNLVLRAGADGAVVEDVTISLGKRPRLTKRGRRDVRRKIGNAIEDLPDPIEEEEEEDEEEVDWEEVEQEEEEVDWEEDDLGGDSVADVDKEADVTPLSNQELWDTLGRERAVDVQAGLSMVKRTLSFDATPAAMSNRPNGYNGTPVPGAYVQGEVYPLALDHKNKNKGALAGLGAAFVVDKVLKISSKLEGGTVDITTTQLRWGIGVRYRINIGDKPSGPTVKFGVGYNKLEFSLDQQQILDDGLDIELPNVSYTYFDPGVMGRLPFGREWAGYADARFMLITDTGDMQQTMDPDGYGSATMSGFDLDVGVEYRLDARLLVRGGLRFQQISFTFDGDGALNDRDGDGMSDVSAATDRYLGGYATAGYLF